MASLDDGPTAGTAVAAGAADAAAGATGSSTGVVGAGASCTGAFGTIDTENAVASIVPRADAGDALPADNTGAAAGAVAGAGTDTVVTSNGVGRAGAPGATGTSTVTAAMVGTTKSSTARTVESTLFYLSVKYREMISYIVSTWRIVRSRSKYKLENI